MQREICIMKYRDKYRDRQRERDLKTEIQGEIQRQREIPGQRERFKE